MELLLQSFYFRVLLAAIWILLSLVLSLIAFLAVYKSTQAKWFN